MREVGEAFSFAHRSRSFQLRLFRLDSASAERSGRIRAAESRAREVHEILGRRNPTGYTTVLKLMQIMTEKGLVERDESRKAHVYRPTISEERTQKSLVTDLLDKAFGGSPAQAGHAGALVEAGLG
jgi:hypothetical protein